MTVNLESVEQALKQIKSVNAARIIVNSQGEIEEIHILTGADRNPKQIVRDVETVLAAQYGIEIDHKKISIAQLGEDEEVASSVQPWVRPKLVGITLRTVNNLAEIKVELQAGEHFFEGEARGFASSYNKFRLFIEATTKALNSLAMDKCQFVPEDMTVVNLMKHKAVLVTVAMVTSAGEETLAGCAIVKNDDREAVVRATLDAVNRKLHLLELTN